MMFPEGSVTGNETIGLDALGVAAGFASLYVPYVGKDAVLSSVFG